MTRRLLVVQHMKKSPVLGSGANLESSANGMEEEKKKKLRLRNEII